MRAISKKEIEERLIAENPWWESRELPSLYRQWQPRPYLELLEPLVTESGVRRAVVLMGPRRVGKTVLIHHLIGNLLDRTAAHNQICYISVDHPIYNGLSLERFLKFYAEAAQVDLRKETCYVFFDEVQYLKEWEKHLKSIVDTYPNIRLLVSGSAAAALRLSSTESGAGRFTDFLLPPLTFHEYLVLSGVSELVSVEQFEDGRNEFHTDSLEELNNQFINYLNYGGYPEVLFSEPAKVDPGRYIKSDIIDKVLLRDLPQLYGIQDIQELNHLFTSLAFNTAGEVSLEELSRGSGVSKNTIKKYIEYLEAAFLIKPIHRIDKSAKRFKRRNYFKIYLTNPSMRAALFSPVSSDDSAVGSLVETAIFSQWFHSDIALYYARWKGGEVDIVSLGSTQKVEWAVEVKWSNRFYDNPVELRALSTFCQAQGLSDALVTSKSAEGIKRLNSIELQFRPASLYAFALGYNIVSYKRVKSSGGN